MDIGTRQRLISNMSNNLRNLPIMIQLVVSLALYEIENGIKGVWKFYMNIEDYLIKKYNLLKEVWYSFKNG